MLGAETSTSGRHALAQDHEIPTRPPLVITRGSKTVQLEQSQSRRRLLLRLFAYPAYLLIPSLSQPTHLSQSHKSPERSARNTARQSESASLPGTRLPLPTGDPRAAKNLPSTFSVARIRFRVCMYGRGHAPTSRRRSRTGQSPRLRPIPHREVA